MCVVPTRWAQSGWPIACPAALRVQMNPRTTAPRACRRPPNAHTRWLVRAVSWTAHRSTAPLPTPLRPSREGRASGSPPALLQQHTHRSTLHSPHRASPEEQMYTPRRRCSPNPAARTQTRDDPPPQLTHRRPSRRTLCRLLCCIQTAAAPPPSQGARRRGRHLRRLRTASFGGGTRRAATHTRPPPAAAAAHSSRPPHRPRRQRRRCRNTSPRSQCRHEGLAAAVARSARASPRQTRASSERQALTPRRQSRRAAAAWARPPRMARLPTAQPSQQEQVRTPRQPHTAPQSPPLLPPSLPTAPTSAPRWRAHSGARRRASARAARCSPLAAATTAPWQRASRRPRPSAASPLRLQRQPCPTRLARGAALAPPCAIASVLAPRSPALGPPRRLPCASPAAERRERRRAPSRRARRSEAVPHLQGPLLARARWSGARAARSASRCVPHTPVRQGRPHTAPERRQPGRQSKLAALLRPRTRPRPCRPLPRAATAG